MRHWMNLVESQQMILYHSSNAQIVSILPFMHLGTLKAAQDRGGKFLYKVSIAPGRSLEVSDDIGVTHNVLGLIERLETDLELDFHVVDDLMIAARAEAATGKPASLAGGAAVAAVLAKYGIDALYYTNKIEDPGSVSWIVINPDCAKLL